MSSVAEVKRVIKYPPEAFLYASPIDLPAGETKVSEYFVMDGYVYVLQGLSFARTENVRARLIIDDKERVTLDDLSAIAGIDFEEKIKLPATKSMQVRLYTPSAVTNLQYRHRVLVMKASTLLKMRLGMALSTRDVELRTKYMLDEALQTSIPEPFRLDWGVEEFRELAVKATSSRSLRLAVPDGYKLIILGLSAERPANPAQCYLNIERDDIPKVVDVDLYCLPSLQYTAPLRVVVTDKAVINIDVKTSGTYRVRVIYGLGKITIPEKIMWGIELTGTERAIAEKYDLFNKIEAGVYS